MAYIGRPSIVGNFVKLDSITAVNGQAAYTMQNGGANFTDYSSVNQFMVSLNSVVQSPGSSFTVSGSTLTFASNLATGDVIDFVIVFGNSLSSGVPTDATVTAAKLTANAITGQTAETSIATDDTILIHDTSASALRKMTRANFVSGIGGDNTPAWYARRNSSQTISNQTYTKIEFGSEVVDTDSAYDNSTNYRWTCPSGKAGKYYIFGNLFLDSGDNANFEYGWMQFRRNGTAFAEHIVDGRSTNGRQYSVGHAFINDVAVGDYYEIFAYISDSSGSPSIKGGSAGASDGNSSNFGGYKLIT